MARAAKSRGSIDFSITVDPSPATVARKLKFLPKKFKSFKPAWRKIAPHLAAGIRENIRSRGAALGEPWLGPKKAYTQRKVREGHSPRQLVRTGELVSKVTDPSSIVRMTNNMVAFGVKNLPYARAVNWSYTHGGRLFFGWNPKMKEHATGILDDHVGDTLVKIADEIFKTTARSE